MNVHFAERFATVTATILGSNSIQIASINVEMNWKNPVIRVSLWWVGVNAMRGC